MAAVGCIGSGVWKKTIGSEIVHYTTYNEVFDRCGCALFEKLGILCQHEFYVLKKKKARELPEHYILSRWTFLSVMFLVHQILIKLIYLCKNSKLVSLYFLTFRYRISHTSASTS